VKRTWYLLAGVALLAVVFWPRSPHPLLSEIPPDDRSLRLTDATVTRLDSEGKRVVLHSEQMTRFDDGRIASGPFTLTEEQGGEIRSLSARRGKAQGDLIEAQGHVVLKAGDVVADAERAEYRRDSALIRLTGNVVFNFAAPPTTLRGPSAEYDLNEGRLVMAEGVKGVMP